MPREPQPTTWQLRAAPDDHDGDLWAAGADLSPGTLLVAYRLGLATSRAQARQLVRHGHLTVNGRKVDIPSFSVKPGDVITVRQSSRKVPAILHAMEEVKGRGVPEWLQFDAEGMAAKVGSIPTREQINLPVQEQLIVELYSK